MMVKECRWMKQKVCSNPNNDRSPAPSYLPPPSRKTFQKSRKDPIQQLLEPISKVVEKILEPIGKLLKQSGGSARREPQCKWVPKEWCEEVPKEWCEPVTKQKCEEVIFRTIQNAKSFQPYATLHFLNAILIFSGSNDKVCSNPKNQLQPTNKVIFFEISRHIIYIRPSKNLNT